MPASLKSITSKRAELVLPLDEKNPDGDQVELTYKPKAMTKAFEREFNGLMAGKDEEMVGAEITIRTFLLVVTRWNLKWDNEDSDPIPLTADGLENVPIDLLQYLLRKIGEDQQLDPTTKTS